MFYVIDPKGNFLAGHVPAGSRGTVMFEGHLVHGEPKITKRFEDTHTSTHGAWESLCMMVSEARANGYRDALIDTSRLHVPADIHQEEFPLGLRSLYLRVNAINPVQFSAGITRMKAVHEVLSPAGVGMVIGAELKSVELRLGARIVRFGFVSERLWETMTTKARELSDARRMLDDNELLPDGRGLLHIRTMETALDLYVRAFLHGAIKAGAGIDWSSDHPWDFVASDPFKKSDVENQEWFKNDPGLYSCVLKLDQTIPVRTTKVVSALDFYL